MMGRSHIAFGIGSYILAGELLPYGSVGVEWLSYTPFAILGSLLPDLDHYNSILKRNTFIKLITLPLTFFGHRSWSHSLLILAVFYMLSLYAIPALQMPLFALFIGVASHILGDWMTPAGVPLFYPLGNKFRSPLTFHVGSILEYPIAIAPTLLFLFYFFDPNTFFG